MGEAIKFKIICLLDNDAFIPSERLLSADEIILTKLAYKKNFNIYCGLDKRKARICSRGDMQIKNDFISLPPTSATRLLKCLWIMINMLAILFPGMKRFSNMLSR